MVEFIVHGDPVGKARPRFTRNGRAYTPKKTTDYETLVKACWKARRSFGDAPVRADITCYFAMPKSWSDRRKKAKSGQPCTKRPDADNIAKAILDALNGLAYDDDSQIVALTVRKFWAREGGAIVKLEEVENDEQES